MSVRSVVFVTTLHKWNLVKTISLVTDRSTSPSDFQSFLREQSSEKEGKGEIYEFSVYFLCVCVGPRPPFHRILFYGVRDEHTQGDLWFPSDFFGGSHTFNVTVSSFFKTLRQCGVVLGFGQQGTCGCDGQTERGIDESMDKKFTGLMR